MRYFGILLGILVAGVLAVPTQASVLLTDHDGRWLHQHTRVYTYSIDPSVPSWWASAVDRAAAEWSRRSAVLTVVKTSGSANIRVRAVYDPNPKTPIGRADVNYHAPGTITFNTYRLTNSLTTTLLGVAEQDACHELGHEFGLGHGGTGCMSTNRQDGDGGEPGIRLALDTRHPGADDVALLDRTYPATGH